MAILLHLTLVGYAAGLLLPLCFPGKPKLQNVLAHGLACFSGIGGICVGIVSLLTPEPFTMSVPSTLPLLTFAIRVDPLASFFLLTISLVSLAASIYAIGYVTEFYGRRSIALLGSLYNGFLLSMTLVVLAYRYVSFVRFGTTFRKVQSSHPLLAYRTQANGHCQLWKAGVEKFSMSSWPGKTARSIVARCATRLS
jgi:formate hydrogenlyase subunit 3/multisubunit Na+/H+ antiporter MnhD subunit